MKMFLNARTQVGGSMLQQVKVQRKRLDLPITLEDLKYGAKKIIGDKNLNHLNDKLA